MLFRLLLTCLLLVQMEPASAFSVKYSQTFEHDGQNRIYYLNVPPDLPPGSPLIVALHGMGGQAHKMRYGLGLHDLAFEKGFAALFPQGGMYGDNTTYWNAGEGPGNHDDVGFLNALIAEVVAVHDLDPNRVYVMGISNGGQMAYHLACHTPDQISAIAAIIGPMTGSDWMDCPMHRPVSLLHVHGVLDPIFDIEGGPSWHGGPHDLPAVPKMVNFWADQLTAERVLPPDGPQNTEITLFKSPDGAVAELVLIQGFGHDWPHANNAGFSTSHLVTDFFLSLERE